MMSSMRPIRSPEVPLTSAPMSRLPRNACWLLRPVALSPPLLLLLPLLPPMLLPLLLPPMLLPLLLPLPLLPLLPPLPQLDESELLPLEPEEEESRSLELCDPDCACADAESTKHAAPSVAIVSKPVFITCLSFAVSVWRKHDTPRRRERNKVNETTIEDVGLKWGVNLIFPATPSSRKGIAPESETHRVSRDACLLPTQPPENYPRSVFTASSKSSGTGASNETRLPVRG
jgi:hypothetical protein